MLLAGTCYDPSTAATSVTTSLTAMTALDTTNLRLTFTAPTNGIVLVRIRGVVTGATTMPTILMGVLESTTVKGRVCPVGTISGTAVASTHIVHEALFVVPGLTGGNSYTWDAAIATQVILANTALRWGGPNDTTTNNAYGGLQFEVWEAPNCLGAKLYDPSSAVSKATTGNTAMAGFDTTNLRIAFTAPASGKVLVRVGCPVHGAATFPQILLGVLESSTVKLRVTPIGGLKTTALATAQLMLMGQGLVTGLTPGNSYTYDAAWASELGVTSTGLKYGGPDNNSGNNAWGACQFEVWAV
jgi:hypothetical protein